MFLTLLGVAAQLALSLAVKDTPEITQFPGSYYDQQGRINLQRRVMERWPGPTALAQMWGDPEIKQRDRIAILLGAAAFRDPSLIPIYKSGLKRPADIVRQAAAYGFRDLLGDRPPNVTAGLSEADLRRLYIEMDNVRRTMQRHTLTEMWLHTLLRTERRGLPGFRGFAPHRSVRDSLRSIEKVMTVDDLEALVRAYRASEDRTVRIGLFRLIESVTLSRFLPKRMGATPAWTPEMFDQGMAALETEIARWESRKCSLGVNGILAARMAEMGAPVSNPRSAEACAVWLNVMRVGDESWWPTAAKQLYLCGGPWIELSVLWSDSAENRARRDRFLDWYRPPIKKPEPTKTPVFPAP